jgi:hypothetical protein
MVSLFFGLSGLRSHVVLYWRRTLVHFQQYGASPPFAGLYRELVISVIEDCQHACLNLK